MLYRFKYPKLTLLIASIIIAYIFFTSPISEGFTLSLEKLGYPGVFIMGMLFPIGFTTPFSVGFFLILNPDYLILNALIGAFGAMISNLLIFSLIRLSFREEILSLEKDIEKIKLIKELEIKIKKDISKEIRHYLIYIFIGIIIASPISDDFADVLLAGFTKVKPLFLAIFSFILHFIGISILLWI